MFVWLREEEEEERVWEGRTVRGWRFKRVGEDGRDLCSGSTWWRGGRDVWRPYCAPVGVEGGPAGEREKETQSACTTKDRARLRH